MHRLFAPILLLAACAAEPYLSEDSDAITDEGAIPAQPFFHQRAVKITEGVKEGCSATHIHGRYVLTAAHCLGDRMRAEIGDLVEFYKYGSHHPVGLGKIEGRRARVDVDSCYADPEDNCYDNGNRADFALLRLSAANEDDVEGPQATLAWVFPGTASGQAVGNGRHNGQDNVNVTLKQTNGSIDDSSDDDGDFDTAESETDDGDSGGPFYSNGKVVGVLAGSYPSGGLYTSVPFYINYLLTHVGYRWRGQPVQSDTTIMGDLIEVSDNSELTCQYACEKTTECSAYNWKNNACFLYKNVSTATTQSGWHSAYKGGRVGTSGEVVGFVRSDGIHAVVHLGSDYRLRELVLVGPNWVVNDIQGSAPAAGSSRITALLRADGTNTIYYRTFDGDIIELALESDGYHHANLSSITNAPLAAGAPVAYVRGDGVTAVVYRSTGGHIIELRLGSRGWISRDLNAASSSSNVVVSSDPSVSVRADGTNSIVFRAGTQIWELYQSNTADITAFGVGGWRWGTPSGLTGNPAPPPAAGRPVGYSHRNGIHAIAYRSTTDQIIELWLDGSGWHWGVLANGAKGDPTAYTRNDGRESVLFRNASNHIIQAYNSSGWSTLDLTTVTGTSAATSDPYVYHRADGYNSILFEANGHVNELWYKRGQGNWAGGDVTAGAGETP
jgi:Trypsin